MNSNISISKGVFVFKKNVHTSQHDKRYTANTKNVSPNIYSNHPWYQAYTNLWRNVEKRIKILHKETFSCVLTDLLNFIKNSYCGKLCEIPTAALLTGINMPDHVVQFSALAKQIKLDISPHVACLFSQDCQSIKLFVENMINQFINGSVLLPDESEFQLEKKYKMKKGQYSFSTLRAWYEKEHDIVKQQKTERQLRKYQQKLLVVILADFEGFNNKVLQEFILICSSYTNILPFVFVFGIATSLSILHKTLPYHVSSKVNIQYFSSQSSTIYLNDILEKVFLTNECAFHLGGSVFALFLNVFKLYDLSVTGFIKKYKYAMLEHFSCGNTMTLCTKKDTADIIAKFNHEDCENIRYLVSFRSLVENETFENQVKLLTDDGYFKSILYQEICKLQQYLITFNLFLKCFKILIADLPSCPFGNQIGELYCQITTSDITKTEDYKKYLKLLQCQSKDELEDKMSEITALIEDECKPLNTIRQILKHDLKNIYNYLEEMDDPAKPVSETDILVQEMENVNINSKDRKCFLESLLNRTQRSKSCTNYEIAKIKLITFMDSLFEKYLYCPTKLPFHEIFFFNDISIENHVIGSHRAAIHTALNDPQQYLQCKCCIKENDAMILKTMPDICIIYKLHLEYGKMINLYDWLQAFASIVNPICADEEDEIEIDAILQARFTMAVAELEFLGFVKSSKRKTDHVQRLTWGG